MGVIKRPPFFYSLLLFVSVFFYFLHPISAADNTNLVYKGCAEQKLEDPSGIYSQNLKSLLSSLVSQSSQKPFATTTVGEGQNAIMGLYQCRGDLSNPDCYNCVNKIPESLRKLCGNVVAARIQLNGCYLRYEIVGFKQIPETQMLYKVCGSIQASGSGFEERRDTAFGMVENGVKSSGTLFYTGSYQSVYVLGQCEGDLASGDCGDCVKSADDQAKAQCGDSISAQVYLHKCFISYSFYPSGVPTMNSSSGKAVGKYFFFPLTGIYVFFLKLHFSAISFHQAGFIRRSLQVCVYGCGTETKNFRKESLSCCHSIGFRVSLSMI